MTLKPLDDDFARGLRRAWFDFLDAVEPHRRDLYRYCRALTGDIWSAEDLCQETLLRAYAALGRGDLHGESSRLRSLRAYLLRAASNLWIDQVRRARREGGLEPDAPAPLSDAETSAGVRDAAVRLLRDVPPKERAAVVLKDAFDLTLEEIAELLSTSVGAVKSALHRGRERLRASPPSLAGETPSAVLVDRFVAAFNARDSTALAGLLLETVTVEVPGVGGGRGNVQIWVEKSIEHAPDRVERREHGGETLVLYLARDGGTDVLCDVVRLEEADGRIGRLIDYCFCPDTLEALAAELGLAARTMGYHQPPAVLVNMIATTGAPWLSP